MDRKQTMETSVIIMLLVMGCSAELWLAAFNFGIFGETKMSRQHAVDTLIEIVQRYDILCLQEIRDSSEEHFPNFVSLLNQADTDSTWLYSTSARLGRTSSKEQYAFLYRKEKATLTDTHQYVEPAGTDPFEREPYSGRFTVNGASITDLGVMCIHVKPSDAVNEINELTAVYDDVSAHWRLEDILIAGDLNAGCSYVGTNDWKDLSLATDSRYKWYISNETDTTSYKTQCAYDRLVATGTKLKAALDTTSAYAYRFDDVYTDLTYTEVTQVAGHYPVAIKMNGDAGTSSKTKRRRREGRKMTSIVDVIIHN